MEAGIKPTERDWTLAFKRSAVDQIEKRAVTCKGAQRS